MKGDASNQSSRLSVGIVGAGIAGLASAIALRRAGHDVELFERSHFKAEIGAAITITPNGTRVLDHWGIDSGQLAVRGNVIEMVNHQTLEPFLKDVYGDVTPLYGSGFYHWHRVQLHRTLRELAAALEDQGGPTADITLGHKIAEINCEDGLIIRTNGEKTRKDLIIVADGYQSSFNRHFHPSGSPVPLMPNGRSFFRALIPYSAIMSHPALREAFPQPKEGFWVPVAMVGLVGCVTYPCRSPEGELMLNVALGHNTRPEDVAKEDWHSPSSVEDVLEVVSDFAPAVRELLSLAPEVKVYTLATREPLPTLSNGRAVIVGDAAAVMMPNHAQGGTLALEQAAALEMLFAGARKDDVKERARDYDALMRKHTQIVQILSNRTGLDDSEKTKALKMMADPEGGDGGFGDRVPPAVMHMPFSREARDFFYPYDVFEEGRKYLENKRQQN